MRILEEYFEYLFLEKKNESATRQGQSLAVPDQQRFAELSIVHAPGRKHQDASPESTNQTLQDNVDRTIEYEPLEIPAAWQTPSVTHDVVITDLATNGIVITHTASLYEGSRGILTVTSPNKRIRHIVLSTLHSTYQQGHEHDNISQLKFECAPITVRQHRSLSLARTIQPASEPKLVPQNERSAADKILARQYS